MGSRWDKRIVTYKQPDLCRTRYTHQFFKSLPVRKKPEIGRNPIISVTKIFRMLCVCEMAASTTSKRSAPSLTRRNMCR